MRSNYFWPIVLILAGSLFLLSNFGVLPGNVWNWFWAVFLIFLGLSLIFRRRGEQSAAGSDSLALDGAAGARVTFKHGAGRLTVRSGAAPGQLFSGTFGGGLEKDVRREGDRLEVTLRMARQDWLPWMWPQDRLDWDVNFNADIPLELSFETGASENRLDLSALRVTDLWVKTGASSTDLTLPARAGHTRANIQAGAASVNIQVPQGVAARVQGVVGVGALNVDARRFPRRGDACQSDDFETAANRVYLSIQGGVGSVDVR